MVFFSDAQSDVNKLVDLTFPDVSSFLLCLINVCVCVCQVEYSDQLGADWMSQGCATTSTEVTALQPDTLYWFRVRDSPLLSSDQITYGVWCLRAHTESNRCLAASYTGRNIKKIYYYYSIIIMKVFISSFK